MKMSEMHGDSSISVLTVKNLRWPIAVLLVFLGNLAFAHGMSELEKQIIIAGGNLGYTWIGATHMLSGYDHLAFVFGIVFFLTKFRDVVKYITAFTLGHSITLIFATFNAVQINYFLIDAVIALSVCYIAFHNLDGFKRFLNVNAPNMLVMIFGLGLMHGLGLSTRLQQLPLNEDQLLMNIISFNAGIELGQIMALSLMLFVIGYFRKGAYFTSFSKVSNFLLVLVGGLLFLMQMRDYVDAVNADEMANGQESVQSMTSSELAQKDWNESIPLTIPAQSGKEYKFHLDKGAVLEYSWQADSVELFYDLHGEPAGDTSGYFKSFETGTKASASGILTAVFEGAHGWYWRNDNAFPVAITLQVAGQYRRVDLDSGSPTEKLVEPMERHIHDTLD